MNGEQHFRADFGGAAEEGVERIDDSAADAVLDGDEAVIDVAPDDFLEDGGDIAHGNVVDAAAEFGDGSRMAEGPFGAEEADAKRFFESEAAAHDFAIDGFEAAIGEGSLVEAADAFHDGFFAVGGVDLGALRLLELSDLDDDASAGVEQFDDLMIDLIDFQA